MVYLKLLYKSCVVCFVFVITILLLQYFESLELRELEAKLKSAYVNKDRAAQIAEQEATRFEKMVRTFFVSGHKLCKIKYIRNLSI